MNSEIGMKKYAFLVNFLKDSFRNEFSDTY